MKVEVAVLGSVPNKPTVSVDLKLRSTKIGEFTLVPQREITAHWRGPSAGPFKETHCQSKGVEQDVSWFETAVGMELYLDGVLGPCY